jgi:hypothetical protein
MNDWELKTRGKIRLEVIQPCDSKAGLDIVKSEIREVAKEIFNNLEGYESNDYLQEILNSILKSRNIDKI